MRKCVSDTSPKRIDRAGLAKRRTGTRQPCYPGRVSAQPNWSGKKDGDCENFWKFSSLKKIAYLILRAYNLRPGWISGKVYQITCKIKDFPSSHMYRRSILTASSHVQANMVGSSDVDFVSFSLLHLSEIPMGKVEAGLYVTLIEK